MRNRIDGGIIMKSYRISDHTGASAIILPEKGATVISYNVDNREYFYADQENLCSSERPRCGIPFLFPVFGRTPEGSPYPMEIHGFGHTSAWRVISHDTSELKLELCSNEDTRKVYPFRFRVELTFAIDDGKLFIRQKYENHGAETMPYAFGFHPYFAVEDVEKTVISFRAQLEMDMHTGKPSPCTKTSTSLTFPQNAPETGAFFMQTSNCAVIDAGFGRKIKMNFDHNFTRLVLWAVRGKNFVCVEPINSSPNGLVTGDCLHLAPDEYHEAEIFFEII